MEITFMTIHNLTPDANILYASASVVDILGFYPDEVMGKSCFDYFHPEDVPFARHVHTRGVLLDRAAALHYARIKHKNGQWIDCECVFTVVYQVITACTSIYKRDERSQKRAEDAPAVRRLFSSSGNDPRIHMFEYMSHKFAISPQRSLLEVRAALIVNRFTRTLTVMYATNAVNSILGVSPEQLQDKSFYECMQEICLPDAIRCIESAKANDSIAYLRFWARDPRRQEDFDSLGIQRNFSEVAIDSAKSMNFDSSTYFSFFESGKALVQPSNQGLHAGRIPERVTVIHDDKEVEQSISPRSLSRSSFASRNNTEPYELEGVVSCTSDGLVVVLRRVQPSQSTIQHKSSYFAAPWGLNPTRPNELEPSTTYHEPQCAGISGGCPSVNNVMASIQDVAVFAWGVTDMYQNVTSYAHETPSNNLNSSESFGARQLSEKSNLAFEVNERIAPARVQLKNLQSDEADFQDVVTINDYAKNVKNIK